MRILGALVLLAFGFNAYADNGWGGCEQIKFNVKSEAAPIECEVLAWKFTGCPSQDALDRYVSTFLDPDRLDFDLMMIARELDCKLYLPRSGLVTEVFGLLGTGNGRTPSDSTIYNVYSVETEILDEGFQKVYTPYFQKISSDKEDSL